MYIMHESQGFLQLLPRKTNDATHLEMIQSVKSTKDGRVVNFTKDGAAHWNGSMDSCGGHGYSDGTNMDGNDFPNTTRTCLQSVYGDSIAIGKLLEIGNISLDDSNNWNSEGSNISLRFTGLLLNLDIYYENNDPDDFWSWPYGKKHKYTYKVSRVRLPSIMWAQPKSILSSSKDSSSGKLERVVVKRAGIDIRVRVHGSHGSYSVMGAFQSLVVSTTIVTLTGFLINHGLSRIYRCLPKTKTLAMMFEWYKYDESAPEHEVRQKVRKENGRMTEVDENVRQKKCDRLSGKCNALQE